MAQIVLVTGKPRIGKTAFVVEMLMFDDYYKSRKLFSNINGLDLPHHPPPEGHSWEDMHIWLKYKENIGSIVVFDEVQNLFPTRSNGSKIPENVAWLNVHGHSAIDLIFITQSPKLIDLNLREVVGKHIHIASNKMGGLTRLEWNEVAMNPTAQAKNALSSSHKINEEVFNYYKSAEAHTGHEHVKSRWYYVIISMLIIVPILLSLVGFMGYRYYQQFKEKAYIEQKQETESTSQTQQINNETNTTNLTDSMMPAVQQNQSLTAEMFIPTLAERPESKPIYDSIRQVKQYERIAACIKGGKSDCTCYSDQATKLREITKEMCIEYAENGLPFDPFRDETQPNQQVNTNETVENHKQTQIAVMGGEVRPTLTPDYPENLKNIQ